MTLILGHQLLLECNRCDFKNVSCSPNHLVRLEGLTISDHKGTSWGDVDWIRLPEDGGQSRDFVKAVTFKVHRIQKIS